VYLILSHTILESPEKERSLHFTLNKYSNTFECFKIISAISTTTNFERFALLEKVVTSIIQIIENGDNSVICDGNEIILPKDASSRNVMKMGTIKTIL
jgi:hypothetical protein